ncbi:unnamed protein product, partial [Cylicocyclus nassatus]
RFEAVFTNLNSSIPSSKSGWKALANFENGNITSSCFVAGHNRSHELSTGKARLTLNYEKDHGLV